MSKIIRWTYSGDVNMLDYGGSYIRNVGGRKFQRIRVENLEDTDIKGEKYWVTLDYINLEEVSEKEIYSALMSCGCGSDYNYDIENDVYVARCMFDYSGGCNLSEWRSNNGFKAIAEAKRYANMYLGNSDKLEASLNRIVNAIGSTSRELGCGDIQSALNRGKSIEDLKDCGIVKMKHTDILKCQFAILEMSHYRGDGSCLCNDSDHREFMIKNWGYRASDFKPEE